MRKIALIGAGGIGSRHLQGLALSKEAMQIEVVDVNKESLKMAKQRYEEVRLSGPDHIIHYYNDIKEADPDIELAIIATSSKPRKEIVEYVANNMNVKYLLLEKFAFQSELAFDEIQELLNKKHITAWVNNGRRYIKQYHDLRKEIKNDTFVNMNVMGGEWGLGCNGIHMLDFYHFISGASSYKENGQLLDPGWKDSKRDGYIEFTGQAQIISNKGVFIACSVKGESSPTVISIVSSNHNIIINEVEKKVWIWNSEKKGFFERELDIKKQSEMTGIIVDEIIENGKCELPSFTDSIMLHKCLLRLFCKHMEKETGEAVKTCPIT